jgi:hypothetical protein
VVVNKKLSLVFKGLVDCLENIKKKKKNCCTGFKRKKEDPFYTQNQDIQLEKKGILSFMKIKHYQ